MLLRFSFCFMGWGIIIMGKANSVEAYAKFTLEGLAIHETYGVLVLASLVILVI